jgi:hypothetical protein
MSIVAGQPPTVWTQFSSVLTVSWPGAGEMLVETRRTRSTPRVIVFWRGMTNRNHG